MTIDINNLTFGYDILLFDCIDLTIHNNTFTSILGKNGCGKSSLVKILIGDLDYSGEIKYNNIILDNKSKEDIRRNISVIFNNYNDMFIFDNIYDDLTFQLEKSGYITSIIEDVIYKTAKELDLVYLIHKKVSELSESEKVLAIILCMIINKPSVLIMDDILNNIEFNKKKEIINYLKKQNITIINITSNTEDILLSDEVVIINNKNCIKNNIKDLLNNDNLFNECNLKLPFMADLSKKLIYYNLLDKIILDKNKLVDEIWK